jgi:drug/metabolite transporter (DMT)-like permease
MSAGSEESVSVFVFAIVLASAFTHASWNLAARKVKGQLSVFVGGLVVATVCLTPFAFASEVKGPILPALPFVFATGVTHVCYVYLLSAMYSHVGGSISVVYPISRGTGVAMTALLAGPVLGETVSIFGAVGIGSIVVGIFLMGVAKLNRTKILNADKPETSVNKTPATANPLEMRTADGQKNIEQQHRNIFERVCSCFRKPQGALLLGLMVGCIITTYSLVDKNGVGLMNPVQYMYGMRIVELCFFLPYFLGTKERRQELINTFRTKFVYVCIVGVGGFATYLTILYALTLSKASFITALRECSVIFGALFGVFILHESPTVTMVAGIVCIVTGLVLIKTVG